MVSLAHTGLTYILLKVRQPNDLYNLVLYIEITTVRIHIEFTQRKVSDKWKGAFSVVWTRLEVSLKTDILPNWSQNTNWIYIILLEFTKRSVVDKKKECIKCFVFMVQVNSLWPSVTIWWQICWSTFVQVRASCLPAASHYLNQCWFIFKCSLRNKLAAKFQSKCETFHQRNVFENVCKIAAILFKPHCVNPLRPSDAYVSVDYTIIGSHNG